MHFRIILAGFLLGLPLFSAMNIVVPRGQLLPLWAPNPASQIYEPPSDSHVLQDGISGSRSDLQLEIRVITQRYCKAMGDATDDMKMELELRYTNLSKDRLIFYKYSHHILRFSVSRNAEDALAKQFEMDATQTFYTDESVLKISDQEFDKYFVVLLHNESYRTTTDLVVPVSRDNSLRRPSALSDGEHVLQVRVATWPGNADTSSADLKEKWRYLGMLWSKNAISLPVRFEIQRPYQVERCQ